MARPNLSDGHHWLSGTRPTRARETGDVAPGRPKFPRELSRAERKTFKRLVADLESRRHATPGDREVLCVYCRLVSRWESALADVEARGAIIDYTYVDKNGAELTRQKTNPFLTLAQQTEKQMFAILQSLGLTPVARAKVKAAKTPEAEAPVDPFEELMASRKSFVVKEEDGERVN